MLQLIIIKFPLTILLCFHNNWKKCVYPDLKNDTIDVFTVSELNILELVFQQGVMQWVMHPEVPEFYILIIDIFLEFKLYILFYYHCN